MNKALEEIEAMVERDFGGPEAGQVYFNTRENYQCPVEILGENRAGPPGWERREWLVRDVFPGRPYKYWTQRRFLEPMTEMEVIAWAAK